MPKMAALEEEFTLSAVPLGAGPDGLLGVEQCDKTDQFLITDSGRTVLLYKVRPIGPSSSLRGGRWDRSAPLLSRPLQSAEPEPWVSHSFRENNGSSGVSGKPARPLRNADGKLEFDLVVFLKREAGSELHAAKRLSARGPDSERKGSRCVCLSPWREMALQPPFLGSRSPLCPLKCRNGDQSGGRG